MKKTYNDAPETLLAAILSMQEKIIENEDRFKEEELAQDVEMGDGRIVCRTNPFVQEYRALVKDFSQALKAYREIAGDAQHDESDSLADMRSRLKVIV